MPVAVKPKRIRVTRKDIETARYELLKQPKPVKPKIEQEAPRYKKDFWYGWVYCDSNGWASIVGEQSSEGVLQGVWLGKTGEFIPYLKSRRIDGENVDMVLQAAKEFWSEKKSYSCHLAMESYTTPISIPPAKPIVATFKKDPYFLRLLERLISQGLGIRAISSELKSQGYEIPLRTLGRWVKERRGTI